MADTKLAWLAEEVVNGSAKAIYLVRGTPGVPAHLTYSPHEATHFATRQEALDAATDAYVRGFVSPSLEPIEHGFG
jgi:hypothetical protein